MFKLLIKRRSEAILITNTTHANHIVEEYRKHQLDEKFSEVGWSQRGRPSQVFPYLGLQYNETK